MQDDPLSAFDYSAHCILVLDFEALRSTVNPHALEADPLQSLACWDGILLMVRTGSNASILQSIIDSALAPRIAICPADGNGKPQPTIAAIQLNRLVATSRHHPRKFRPPVDTQLLARLALLPAQWRAPVHQAMAWPADWSVARLAQACCTTTRTLQRHFRSVGLPAPRHILKGT